MDISYSGTIRYKVRILYYSNSRQTIETTESETYVWHTLILDECFWNRRRTERSYSFYNYF